MAGLFQVLDGAADGTFAKPRVLNGRDGAPLIITAEKNAVTTRICTRPTAVDLDADGHLDIVAGNFKGTFHLFRGNADGFAPTSTELVGTDGKPLRINAHSDPYLADWDGDGDLDLFSGSIEGGVHYAENVGSATAADFKPFTPMIKPVTVPGSMQTIDGREVYVDETRIGTDFLTGPQTSTRVYVADVNADGALDVLVGDTVTLYHPVDGATADAALAVQKTFAAQEQAHFATYPTEPDDDVLAEWTATWEAMKATRDETVRVEITGFVWVYHRK